MDRIKSVASEAIVKQVGAIYLFDVAGESKFHQKAIFCRTFCRLRAHGNFVAK